MLAVWICGGSMTSPSDGQPRTPAGARGSLIALVVGLSIVLVGLVVGLVVVLTSSSDDPIQLASDATTAMTTPASSTAPSSTVAVTSIATTTAPTTTPPTTPPTLPPTSPPTTRRAGPSFYGDWSVHGGGATFRADGTGTARNHAGFTTDNKWLDEVLTLKTTLSNDGATLTATIVSVSYTGDGATLPNYRPQYPSDFSAGDTFAITFEQPQLLKVTAIKAKRPDSSFGNPHLCGPGLSPQFQSLCGA